MGDPDGLLGGSVPPSSVGLMGFSMGGFIASTAFGMERRVRLIQKRRFAQNHFEHIEKQVRPKRRFCIPKMKKTEVFQSKIVFLEMAHANFVYSIRKTAYQPSNPT